MKIYSIGTIFVMVSIGLNAFITTQGFSKYSMLNVVIGALSNIILDPIFIFVFKYKTAYCPISSTKRNAAPDSAGAIYLKSKNR